MKSVSNQTSAMTLPYLSNKVVSILAVMCGLLAVTYVALMIFTVSLATWQMQSASSVHDSEAAIADLESQYYSALAQVNAINPSSAGYVTPHSIVYVAGSAHSGLSIAQRGR